MTPESDHAPDFSLSGAEKKQLRGQAQLLEPHVHVGKQGVTPEVLQGIELAFQKAALIKIRFASDRGRILQQINQIASASGSFCVCNVGKTAAFFRPKPAEDAAGA